MKFLNQILLLVILFFFSYCSTIDTAVEEEPLIQEVIEPTDSLSYFVDKIQYSFNQSGSYKNGHSSITVKGDSTYFHPDSIAIYFERSLNSDISGVTFGITKTFHKESPKLNLSSTGQYYPKDYISLWKKDQHSFSLNYDYLFNDNGVFIIHQTPGSQPYFSYDTSYGILSSSLPLDIHKDSFFKLISFTDYESYFLAEFEFEVNLFPKYHHGADYPNDFIRLEKGYLRMKLNK